MLIENTTFVITISLVLLIVTISGLAIFLSYVKKNYEQLVQSILNCIYFKLAIFIFIFSLIAVAEIIMKSIGLEPGRGTLIYLQIRVFLTLLHVVILIELSVVSILRVVNKKMYLSMSTTHYGHISIIVEVILVLLVEVGIHGWIASDRATKNDDNGEYIEAVANLMKNIVGPVTVVIFLANVLVILFRLYGKRKKIKKWLSKKYGPRSQVYVIEVQNNNFVQDESEDVEILTTSTISVTVLIYIGNVFLAHKWSVLNTIFMRNIGLLGTLAMTPIIWIVCSDKLRGYTWALAVKMKDKVSGCYGASNDVQQVQILLN